MDQIGVEGYNFYIIDFFAGTLCCNKVIVYKSCSEHILDAFLIVNTTSDVQYLNIWHSTSCHFWKIWSIYISCLNIYTGTIHCFLHYSTVTLVLFCKKVESYKVIFWYHWRNLLQFNVLKMFMKNTKDFEI